MAKEVTKPQQTTDLQQIEKEILRTNPALLKGIPEGKKKEILQFFMVTTTALSVRSAPLPTPQDMSAYNDVIPNGADRIMKMAEKQQEHRMAIEKKVIGRQTLQSQVGQIFALIIGLAAIGGAVWVILSGFAWPGAVLGVGGVLGLVKAFMEGKKQAVKSLEEKNR